MNDGKSVLLSCLYLLCNELLLHSLIPCQPVLLTSDEYVLHAHVLILKLGFEQHSYHTFFLYRKAASFIVNSRYIPGR